MNIIKVINSSKFFKNTMILIIGTTIAQLIPLITQIYLRREFSPDDFGVYSVFINIVSILSLIAPFRYDITIVLPQKDKISGNLLFISVLLTFFFSIIIFIIILLFYKNISTLIGFKKEYSYYIWFLPLSVLLFSLYQPANMWLIRNQKFKLSSINKVTRRLGEGITQMGFAIIKKPIGLILGDLVGNLIIVISGFFQLKKSGFKFTWLSKRYLFYSLNKYIHYPKYNLIPTLLDAIALSLPVIFINKFFSSSDAGYFDLTQIAIVAPFSLISRSISQVLLQKTSESNNVSKQILPDYLKITSILFIISIIAIVTINLFGTTLFQFVFGDKWLESGVLAKTLIYSYAIRFIVSPLSVCFVALQKVKIQAVWQIVYFIFISSLIFMPKENLYSFLKIYVLIEVFAYAIYFLLIFNVLKNNDMKTKLQF